MTNHEIIVQGTPLEKAWELILAPSYTLDRIGSRIIFDGLPLYVGQTIAERGRKEVTGVIEKIILTKAIDVPAIHCSFPTGKWVVEPSNIVLPSVTMEVLNSRNDDFFEALRIGDAIGPDVCNAFTEMAPLLIDEEHYLQIAGHVGVIKPRHRRPLYTFLTLKRFPKSDPHWRYMGLCTYGDDCHHEDESDSMTA